MNSVQIGQIGASRRTRVAATALCLVLHAVGVTTVNTVWFMKRTPSLERLYNDLQEVLKQLSEMEPAGHEAAYVRSPSDPESVRLASLLVAAGQSSAKIFGDEPLIANPAWNLLLDLYLHAFDGKQVSVSSACIAAGVPPTTGLRWIEKLLGLGLVDRMDDPKDGRRVLISLSIEGQHKVKAALDATAKALGPLMA